MNNLHNSIFPQVTDDQRKTKYLIMIDILLEARVCTIISLFITKITPNYIPLSRKALKTCINHDYPVVKFSKMTTNAYSSGYNN